ncbi:MAG: transcriptional regulator GcvA [Halofilum sp. (in: g-proteobacteria)]|nr:transcriptional regulator GcvA [Halofilum sp. (in: g-proteobacteria)]
MGRELPPLNALRAFEAAGRHLSFTRAAEELNVTPAAVSHQVNGLEQYLGLRLFKRHPQGLLLTEAGQRALPGISTGFEHLSSAMSGLVAAEAERPLLISVTPSLAARWLVPRLEDFWEKHPEIEIRIDAREETSDMRRDDVDIGLRYGTGNYPGLHVECIGTQRVFPVCSPWLAEGEHPLREPADLRHHTLIHVDWRRGEMAAPAWRTWLEAAGVAHRVRARGGPRFTHHSMSLQAAVAGHGVALGSTLLVVDDLAAGRLVRPFEVALEDQYCYYFVCLPESMSNPRVRAFRDWVFGELAVHAEVVAGTAAEAG